MALVCLTNGCAEKQNNSQGTVSNELSGPTIVFLDLDSLLLGYDFYKDKRTELEDQAKQADKILQGKIEAFQKRFQRFQQEVVDIQQRANAIAPVEMRKLEEKYAQQQQNLAKEEEALMKQREANAYDLEGKLLEAQKTLQSELDTYLEKISKERNYDYVLMKGSTGSVMYGKATLDITQETIEALNKIYNAGGVSDDATVQDSTVQK